MHMGNANPNTGHSLTGLDESRGEYVNETAV